MSIWKVSQFLFSQKAWEKGSFTMLSARYINPSKSVNKKASSEKRKLTDLNKLDESLCETDAISTKKPKLTHTDTHQVTASKTTVKPPAPATPPKQSTKKMEPFNMKKKYPCQWNPKCKLPARFCGEGARLPKHCIQHRQPSANLDFYLLKGRQGFPFDEGADDENSKVKGTMNLKRTGEETVSEDNASDSEGSDNSESSDSSDS
jgi:hypothetical protein